MPAKTNNGQLNYHCTSTLLFQITNPTTIHLFLCRKAAYQDGAVAVCGNATTSTGWLPNDQIRIAGVYDSQ
jgi:hypothetical protein